MANDPTAPLETPVEPVVDPVDPADEPADPVEPSAPQAQTPEQLTAANKKLFERAKKAEAELKALKQAPKPAAPGTAPTQSVEETVLLANGMDEELLQKLKAVAIVNKIPSLLKAQADPIFVAIKAQFEKDKKTREAALPASRGAGSSTVPKTFATPGLSREDHKKMVLESGV